MQPDASVEFANINSLRKFPLAEGQAPVGDSGLGDSSNPLPDDLIVDFRAFSCGVPLEDSVAPSNGLQFGPRLTGIIGPDAGPAAGTAPENFFQAVAGTYRFYFGLGTKQEAANHEQWLVFSVPAASMVEGHVAEASVAFANSAAGWPMAFAGGRMQLGPGAPDWVTNFFDISWIPPGAGSDTPTSTGAPVTLLERELVKHFYGGFLGPMSVVDSDLGETPVRGRGTVVPGYNMIARASDDSLELTPERGAGLGVPPAPEESSSESSTGDDDLGDCIGNINHINGERPNPDGDFFIEGQNGILVEEDEDGHQIILSIQASESLACDLSEDLIDTIFFRYTEGTYTIPHSTALYVKVVTGTATVDGHTLDSESPDWNSRHLDPVFEMCHEEFTIVVPEGAEVFGYYEPCGVVIGEETSEETTEETEGTESSVSETSEDYWVLGQGFWDDDAQWLDDGEWID